MGIATATSRGTTAAGGASKFSPGAASTFWDGTNMTQAGASASGKGGGGAGAMSGASGAAKAGGDGSDGVIIIFEYSWLCLVPAYRRRRRAANDNDVTEQLAA
jgi:hypothetical protein